MAEEEPSQDSGREAETARSAVLLRDLVASDALLRDAVARRTGLNATDVRTVEVLLRDGPLTPGELAVRVGVTSGGAVTVLIDRLQKAGLVTRRRHPKDRRKVVVAARAAVARERVGDAAGRVGERWAAYLDTLTDDELAFANELFTEAAALHREAAAELDAFTTGAAVPSSPPPAEARRAPAGAGGARGGRPPTPR